MSEASNRKRLQPGQRRALVVGAAGELFGERGYDATRLDEIAAKAGVTKPILYRHFASKQALYLSLLERHRDDLDRLAGAMPAEGTLEERFRVVVGNWVVYVEEHTFAWQMLFRDRGGGPEVEAFRAEVHARARAVLVEVIRTQGQVRIPRAELEPLAELMSMGMASLVLWWMDHPTVSRDAIVAAITRVWTGLLSERRR
jgi:AcrR family transcriptional regulator